MHGLPCANAHYKPLGVVCVTILLASERSPAFTPPAAAEAVYPFDAPAMTLAWWETLAVDYPILARRGDWALVDKTYGKGLVRAREIRPAGWPIAGDWSQTLCAERLEDFWALQAEWPWDLLRLRWTEAHRNPQALSELRSRGFEVLETPGKMTYAVDLSHGMAAYYGSLTAKERYNLKSKVKKAEALSPTVVRYEGPEAQQAFLDRFIACHRAYWGGKPGGSYLDKPREQQFVRQWAAALAQSGQLRLWGLQLGDEMVHLNLSVLSGDALYWPLVINTGRHTEYYPGIVALHAYLEQSVREGIQTFYMGSGDYLYKRQFANLRQGQRNLWVANPRSAIGRALVWAARLKARQQAIRPATP